MCAQCGCSHDELKADAIRWRSLASLGLSVIDYGDGERETFDVRNAACGSTLYVSVAIEKVSA